MTSLTRAAIMGTVFVTVLGIALALSPDARAGSVQDSLAVDGPLGREEVRGNAFLDSGLIFMNIGLSMASIGSRDRYPGAATTLGALSVASGMLSFAVSLSTDAAYREVVFASGAVAVAAGAMVLLAPNRDPVQVKLGDSASLGPWVGRGLLGLRLTGRF